MKSSPIPTEQSESIQKVGSISTTTAKPRTKGMNKMDNSLPPSYEELTNEKTSIVCEKSRLEASLQRPQATFTQERRRTLIIDIDFDLMLNSPPKYSELYSNNYARPKSGKPGELGKVGEFSEVLSINELPTYESLFEGKLSRGTSVTASPTVKCTCTKLGRVVSWITLFIAVGFCVAAFFSWL